MKKQKIFMAFLIIMIFMIGAIPSFAMSISDVANPKNLLQVSNVTAEELDSALYKNLKGLGYKYVEMEKETGVNAIFIAAISAQESGWGTSPMALKQNNLFGYGGMSFNSKESSIEIVTRALKNNYLSKNGRFFRGYTPNDVAYYYCPNSDWGAKVSNLMNEIAGRVIEYRKAHPVVEEKIEEVQPVIKEVSVEEKVVENYKNGGIIKEVNLILKPNEASTETFINKTNVNIYANLNLYGKCENTKIKIVKINENKKDGLR